MQLTNLNSDYAYAGFFSAGTVSMMHFQDIIIAIVLGFFGGFGGFLFKLIKDKWLNKQ